MRSALRVLRREFAPASRTSSDELEWIRYLPCDRWASSAFCRRLRRVWQMRLRICLTLTPSGDQRSSYTFVMVEEAVSSRIAWVALLVLMIVAVMDACGGRSGVLPGSSNFNTRNSFDEASIARMSAMQRAYYNGPRILHRYIGFGALRKVRIAPNSTAAPDCTAQNVHALYWSPALAST